MKQYHVYKFLDKDKNIIYVGKTTNIHHRMTNHFSEQGHLSQDCYSIVEYIEYTTCSNYTDMTLKEIYFINKYKPLYNTVGKYNDEGIEMDLFDNLQWKNYKLQVNCHARKIKKLEQEILKKDAKIAQLEKEKQSVDKYARNVSIINNRLYSKIRKLLKNPYWELDKDNN